MSRRQADHYRPIAPGDRRLVALTQRLAKLQRDWRAQPKPINRWRAEMTPPTSGWKLRLWEQQAGACAYCSGPLLPRYHIDHVIPRSKGGPSHPDNYAIACERCNLCKHAKSAEEFKASLIPKSM